MKRNFYLQHPLMAMHDPRMQNLFDKEGPRGTGAYWIIIEKLSILPAPRAKLEYLRPYCKSKKMPLSYLKKIISEFQLFNLEEDGFFSPEELNPVKKKEKETAKNAGENAGSDAKNDENRQKTSELNPENQVKNQGNTLKNSTVEEIVCKVFKENIKDIITAAAKLLLMLIMMPTILRLRLPSATTSVGRKHRCIPYVPGRNWWTDWSKKRPGSK